MVILKKLGGGGHTEVEVPHHIAVEEILKHLTKGGIAVKENGENIRIEDVRKIEDADKILLVPVIKGG